MHTNSNDALLKVFGSFVTTRELSVNAHQQGELAGNLDRQEPNLDRITSIKAGNSVVVKTLSNLQKLK